ncbi:virulence RhuM family protein [Thiolapillus sp.]|uniref:virulence RhuM family protein n=7 Tax=Thiolapillus sp. TaxID=2017437 RepID=UPI0025F7503B|nr:virulence RhuM family protein [Thiolapillus sp.]
MSQTGLPENAEILLYGTDNGAVKVDVLYRDENFWLTQKRMAELFGVGVPAVSKHLKNIFETRELEEDRVVSILKTTAADGKTYRTRYYNLDAIIAVGYRVNSRQATQFRIWATQTLKEFIIKGFVLDDERLKQGQRFGQDYFDELLERIREIRASERRFYQKITDIYAQCSADYDPNAETTQTFYATVQNKLHWAIHGHTAAELIRQRADASQPHMGLKSWKNAPKGKVLKSDVAVAKNYLDEKELDELNHIVVMYLDYAELQAKKQRLMKMSDWVAKLDAFLRFNDYEILDNPGKVSAKVAKALAEEEYAAFRVAQDRAFESDFDRLVEKSGEMVKKGRES